MEEFESYLESRKRKQRRVAIAFAVAFVGVVAVPFALMQLGVMKKDTFEIFVFADLFVFAGLVRALITYANDKSGIGGV